MPTASFPRDLTSPCLLSLRSFSNLLPGPSAVSSPVLGSPSFPYLCSAFSSLLTASQTVSPRPAASCPSTSSPLSVFCYCGHHSRPHRHQTLGCLAVFPSSQLSSCVNLFLSAHICLLFTVLAGFLLALLSPFQPISLVSQINIPEMHPDVLSFSPLGRMQPPSPGISDLPWSGFTFPLQLPF